MLVAKVGDQQIRYDVYVLVVDLSVVLHNIVRECLDFPIDGEKSRVLFEQTKAEE